MNLIIDIFNLWMKDGEVVKYLVVGELVFFWKIVWKWSVGDVIVMDL